MTDLDIAFAAGRNPGKLFLRAGRRRPAHAPGAAGTRTSLYSSAARARQIFARWREQYGLVRRPNFAPGEFGMGASMHPSVSRKNLTPLLQAQQAAIPESFFCVLAVASAARARQIFARWREQYGLVRERLAQKSNAALASAAGQHAKKWAGIATGPKVVIDNYNQRRTS